MTKRGRSGTRGWKRGAGSGGGGGGFGCMRCGGIGGGDDGLFEGGDVYGLGEVDVEAGLLGEDDVFGLAVAGEGDEFGGGQRGEFAEFAAEGVAVHVGQAD